jgi:enterochelin esterase family protein
VKNRPLNIFKWSFQGWQITRRKNKIILVGLGTKEPDPFPGSVGAFRKMLEEAGVNHTYYESQGTAHEWLTWRRSLYQFAQLLFR